MRWSERIQVGLAIGGMIACVAYTIWSMIVETQVGGFVIQMQAWGDDGRYGVNYTWVLTLFITLGLLGAPLATLALVRSALVGTRPPTTLRATANARRRAILVPSLVVFEVSVGLALFLVVEGRAAAEALGWFTKLALFAVPVSLLSWVAVVEGLAPAGWHQGLVTDRTMSAVSDAETTYYLRVAGRHHTVSVDDYQRVPDGTRVGVLHTGGLLRLTIELHTDLAELGGPPTEF